MKSRFWLVSLLLIEALGLAPIGTSANPAAGANAAGPNYVIAVGIDHVPNASGTLADLAGCVADAKGTIRAAYDSDFLPAGKASTKDLANARKAQTAGDRRRTYEVLLQRGHSLLLADDDEGVLPTRENILAAVDAAQDLLTQDPQARRKSIVLVSVACHGEEVQGISYLCPQDTRIKAPDPVSIASGLQETALPTKEFARRLAALPVRLVFSTFDMCRSELNPPPNHRGALGQSFLPDRLTDGMARDATIVQLPQGTGALHAYSLFACSAGEASYEMAEHSRGAFSYFFERGFLGEAASGETVTVGSLRTFVHDKVKQYVEAHHLDRDQGFQVPTPQTNEPDIATVEDIPLVPALRLKTVYRPGTVSHYQCRFTLDLGGIEGGKTISASEDVTESVLSLTDDGVRIKYAQGNYNGTSVPNDFSLAPVTATLDQSTNTITTDAGPTQDIPPDFWVYEVLSDCFDIRYFHFPAENMIPGKTWHWDHPTELHKQNTGQTVAEADDNFHGKATFIGLKQKGKNASSGQAWQIDVSNDSENGSTEPFKFSFSCLFDAADGQLISLEGEGKVPNPNGGTFPSSFSIHRTQVEAPEVGEGSNSRSHDEKKKKGTPEWVTGVLTILKGLADQSGK